MADIHHFQRSAELEKMLPVHSLYSRVGFMNSRQRELLAQLQARFNKDEPFIDDPAVEQTSIIYAPSTFGLQSHRKVMLVIDDSGIKVEDQFYSWQDIWDERIATTTYSTDGGPFGTDFPAGSAESFCFNVSGGKVDISLGLLDVSTAALDIIVNNHRGRYELKRIK